MNLNSLTNEEIATSFSNGNFEKTYPFLSEYITWEVIGDTTYNGKMEVIENCNQTTKYFNSVQTIFKTDDVIAHKNKVVIRGSAEFLKDGKRLKLISACDIYEFNENKLFSIQSYCISLK